MGEPTKVVGTIYFGGDHFFVKSARPVLKTINGSRWMSGSGTYRLPVAAASIKLLKKLIPEIVLDSRLEKFIEEVEVVKTTIADVESVVPSFSRLYPFQKDAVQFLVSAHGNRMLVLEQGLGKTPTSIVAAEYLRAQSKKGKHDFQILVIGPKSLISNWQREVRAWAKLEARSLWRTTPAIKYHWSITNWETFSNSLEKYFVGWDLVIVDESVTIKSRRSKRFAAIKMLATVAKKIWLLTGSPTTRYNDDLFTQLQICDRNQFTSYWKFVEQYCIVEKGEWGNKIIGNQPLRDPRDDNPDLMFVRAQKQVMPDLPDMIFQTIEVELSARQRKMHDDFVKKFVTELETGEKMITPNVISQLIRLQQITSSLRNLGQMGDVSAKVEAIEDILEGGMKLPLLVWVHWKGTAHHVAEKLESLGLRVAVASGDTEAAEEIQRYKDGKVDALVCSLMVGKFGHTLTNTKTVIYVDKTWNADDYVQSLKRIHRIGLEHSPLVISLVATDSVDQMVEDNLAGKLPGIAKISQQDLATLMKGIGR